MQRGEGQGSLDRVDAGESAGMPKEATPPSSSPQEHHPAKREGTRLFLHLPFGIVAGKYGSCLLMQWSTVDTCTRYTSVLAYVWLCQCRECLQHMLHIQSPQTVEWGIVQMKKESTRLLGMIQQELVVNSRFPVQMPMSARQSRAQWRKATSPYGCGFLD